VPEIARSKSMRSVRRAILSATTLDPAFSMTLQENNSLLVGKKLYRIKSIKKK
jgi:hypothetical protein